MLLRDLIGIIFVGMLSFSVQADNTEPASKVVTVPSEALAETVFELERSMAILQLSTARLNDYQTLAKEVAENRSLQDRVDFLTNVVFLMLVALLLFFYRLRHTQKALNRLKKLD